jgi:hypothetical protein
MNETFEPRVDAVSPMHASTAVDGPNEGEKRDDGPVPPDAEPEPPIEEPPRPRRGPHEVPDPPPIDDPRPPKPKKIL